MRPQAYRVNEPRIVHQTIDGEAILIDFENGAYYSTAGSGAWIWECLSSGLGEEAILETLGMRYTGDKATMESSVLAFIDQLTTASLIVPLDPDAGSPALPAGSTPSAADGPVVFEIPRLDTYTDMQDLLLLDPVHDVSGQGWPVRP